MVRSVAGAFVVLVLAAAAPARAAMVTEGGGGRIGYGVRIGTNLADLRGDFAEIIDPSMKTGLEGGAFLTYRLAPSVALRLEGDFVEKGGSFESEATDDTGNPIGVIDSELEFEYIEVAPLLDVSFQPWGAGGVSPYLVGGPTLSFALSGEFESDFPGFPEQDLSDDMKDTIWGVTGGLGVRYPLGGFSVGGEARYRTDFSDLWDIDDNLESIQTGWSLTLVLSR